MINRKPPAYTAHAASLLGAACLVVSAGASAQQADESPESTADIQEVTVTGSFIKRPKQEDYASPIEVLGQDDIQRNRRTDIGALMSTLPSNTGAFFVRDTQSSGVQSAASINLRGLGPASTLVLLNGRRQTQGGIPNRSGQVFVDVNGLTPLIAVDRVEVVQDGTSALYGSDAIAGVVNFITRDDFSGAEVQTEYRSAEHGDGDIKTFSALFGAGTETSHIMLAAEYVDQDSMVNEDVLDDARLIRYGVVSGFGMPGTYTLIPGQPYNAPYNTLTGAIADPLCGSASIGGARAGILTGTAGGNGACRLALALGGQLFPSENRLNAITRMKMKLAGSAEVFGEVGLSRIRTHRTDSPSYPLSNARIVVPASNPGNFFGGDVVLTARPVGVNGQRPELLTESDTWRGVAGVRGDLGSSGWSYELAGTHSENDQFNTDNDELLSRVVAALNCKGGPDNNLCWNPFGNQFLASPGDATYNSPEVITDFMVQRFRKTRTTLEGIDAVLSGRLGMLTMPGGPLGVAVGLNFRRESLTGDYDEPTKTPGTLANHAVEFPFSGARDVKAAFVELLFPVLDRFEVTGAVRYEDYGSDVTTTDYKLAALWRPADSLSVRASTGTSFRAPSLFEAFGGLTSNITVPQPVLQVTRGNPNVDPEESESYNLGATWSPSRQVSVSLDYWNFDYSEVLAQENGLTILVNDPNDPRIIRDPVSGEITRIFTSFRNQGGLETDGIDLTSRFALETGAGGLSLGLNASWVHSYDIKSTATAPARDGVGSRNQTTFASPVPEWRGNATLGWSFGNQSASVVYRYLSAVRDDTPANISEVESWGTLDLGYAYTFERSAATTLRIGVDNVTDKVPPATSGTINTYEGRLYDPRGRLFYAGVTITPRKGR